MQPAQCKYIIITAYREVLTREASLSLSSAWYVSASSDRGLNLSTSRDISRRRSKVKEKDSMYILDCCLESEHAAKRLYNEYKPARSIEIKICERHHVQNRRVTRRGVINCVQMESASSSGIYDLVRRERTLVDSSTGVQGDHEGDVIVDVLTIDSDRVSHHMDDIRHLTNDKPCLHSLHCPASQTISPFLEARLVEVWLNEVSASQSDGGSIIQ